MAKKSWTLVCHTNPASFSFCAKASVIMETSFLTILGLPTDAPEHMIHGA
jgi:hypothetical protein